MATLNKAFGLVLGFSLLSILSQDYAEAKTYSEHFVIKDQSKHVFLGAKPGDQFGATLTKGDFNADGVLDLAVGSPFAGNGEKEWAGKVDIYLGGKNWANGDGIISILGANAGDQLGSTIESGDLDGDGFDELIIGAYNAQFENERSGQVYVMYGQNLTSSHSFDFALSKPDVRLVGVDNGDGFGLSLSTGDLNGDDIDDLLVGAPFAASDETKNAGMVYGFYGKVDGFEKSFYLMSKYEPDVRLYGKTAGGRFGSAIAIGNFTAGLDNDVAISAYNEANGDLVGAGSIYIYKNGGKLLNNLRTPTSKIIGSKDNGWMGFYLSSSDINYDRIDDLLVGSFPFTGNREEGSAGIYYGGKRFSHKGVELPDGFDISFNGKFNDSLLGMNIVSEDLNGDTYKDFLMGAPGIGKFRSDDEGDAYVLYGSEAGIQPSNKVDNYDLSLVIHGENADDWFGSAVEVMDLNGDKMQDLIIGARYADSSDGTNAGKVFVLYGSKNGWGEKRDAANVIPNGVKRGDLIKLVVETLNVQEKNKDFINQCYQYREFCLFNFLATSRYKDVKIEPEVLLYPDVKPNDPYYNEVVIATMLGIVDGFYNEDNSPFHPERQVSRIQALKIILVAADLVKPLYKFEVESPKDENSYFTDVDYALPYTWWYERYLTFSVQNGLLEPYGAFRPEDNITSDELNGMMKSVLDYMQTANAQTDARRNFEN